MRNFREMLEARWAESKFVCVGLDSDSGKLPSSAHRYLAQGDEEEKIVAYIITPFNREIVEATKDIVCAYKTNLAFYTAHGSKGVAALRRSIMIINDIAPDIPVILDAKYMDTSNTNTGYVKMAFEYCGADAITISPYLGREAAKPFLDQEGKGIFVLCRTSNSGAGEFQDLHTLTIDPFEIPEGMMVSEWMTFLCQKSERLYERVARNVAHEWNHNGNCGLVVGATCPEELARVRKIVGDMPLLIPGIGAEGGDVGKTVKAGKDSRGKGMIINSSRGIIFASSGPDFAEAAHCETLRLHELISQVL